MTEHHIQTRPIDDGDADFLFRLYASTRQDELAPVPWTDEQKHAFLKQQFDAQHSHYQQYFPEASFDVLLSDGTAIGRLYVDRRDDEIRIIDIALLPEHRGRGIGGAIMTELLAEAQDKRLPVRIHVERNNPALRLYERLGFAQVEDQGVYLLMQWNPI